MKDLSEDEVTDRGYPDGVDEALTQGFGHHRSGRLKEAEVKLFQPEEGLMFLFPSYFYHGTTPIETEEQRISMAFDVIPQD